MVANMADPVHQRSKERGGVRRYLDTVTPEEYVPQTGEVDLTELSLTGLADLYGSDKGKIKHHYTGIYAKLIDELGGRHKALMVAEVGVACGASLRMWANYLPNSIIQGFDIRPECEFLCQDLGNVRIHIRDVRQYQHPHRTVDLFVDDGSHIVEDIIGTMIVAQEWVKSGGFYVVEDMSCTYNDNYRDRFNRNFNQNLVNDRALLLKFMDELMRMMDVDKGPWVEMRYTNKLWVLKKR
jgi:hypothetical protein